MPRKKEQLPYVEGYLPRGLRASELRDLCYGKPFDADRIAIFFKFLYNRTRSLQDGRMEPAQFKQLHWMHLEHLFGANNTDRYRDFMLENQLIEVQAPHAYSKTATRYRVHPRCTLPLSVFDISAPLYSRVEITSARAIRANIAYKAFKFNEMLSRLRQPYNVLAPLMRDITVVNNTPEALALLQSLHDRPKYKDRYEFDAQLEAIKNHETEYYFCCNFGSRFHSQFTSLKKELRVLLRFPGSSDVMAELDVVNSQPWITSIVDEELVRRYVPEAYEEVKGVLQSGLLQAPDYQRYRAECAEGVVYERWITLLETKLGLDWRQQVLALDEACGYEDSDAKNPDLDDRSLAKVLFFRVIFAKQEGKLTVKGNRRKLKKNFRVLNELFQAEWPSVWALFAALKRERLACNCSKKKGGHSNLALLMQRIESSLMQEFVLRCMENGINDIVPIYDGALLNRKDLDDAKQLFVEVVGESGAATQPKLK